MGGWRGAFAGAAVAAGLAWLLVWLGVPAGRRGGESRPAGALFDFRPVLHNRAGTAGSADPARRGATLAVHSMAGYAGGFVGPLMIGWILDLAGGMSTTGWGLAFLHVAVVTLLGQLAFLALRPRELAGDRGRGGRPDPGRATNRRCYSRRA